MVGFRIPITARTQKELDQRIADNEKRGFKVIFEKSASYAGVYKDTLFKAIMEKAE